LPTPEQQPGILRGAAPERQWNNPALAGGRSVNERISKWFDTSVFSQPAPFTFGNLGRVLSTVRTDGLQNWDFSIFKDFPIHEAVRAEFRVECFNFTNTPTFAPPGQAFGNPAFGVVSAQYNAPRQVQFGLKIYY